MAESVTVSEKLPKEVLKRLDAIATERNRKRGDILKEALELYLNEWEDCKIAIARLQDSSDEIVTEEEFLGELKEELGWKI
ncbi:MAG: ribbon-helix-helix protein, CopG family [bacterium]|nr:ribbon-helix-helix protein, CopG family [bacterium]